MGSFLKTSGVVAFSIAGLALSPESAWAAGKKPLPDSGAPVISTPTPVRKVFLKPVGTKPFVLPNGSQVNLQADLAALLLTAVTQTPAFSPTEVTGGGGGGDDFCGTHLEIRAAVSTFQLDVFQLGITVGYTPGGASASPITSLNGKADVKVGTVAMEFSVWECTAGSCSAVAATTSSALTAGLNLSMTIDFGVIKTGPDLIFNTPLGGILRKIMDKGMKQLAASERLGELTWNARVREYIPSAGMLIFDAGATERLQPNQSFVVYAVTPATGICNVYRPVAHVHTTQVETVSSSALVDEVLDSRGVQDGDLVMIRSVASAPKAASGSLK